jgi:hypothetical protein
VRGSDGWLLAPCLLDLEGAPGVDEDPLAEELPAATKRWKKEAPTRVLREASVLGGLPAERAPDSRQARNAGEAWRGAIVAGDVKRAVASAALFDNDLSANRFLRNLGHDLVSARRNPQQGEIIAANQSGRWAAASMRIDGPDGPSFPFYAVVLSDDGPRVLPEVELFHGGSRSRNFLNRAAWSRLEDLIPAAAVTELRTLFDQHTALVEAALKAGQEEKGAEEESSE